MQGSCEDGNHEGLVVSIAMLPLKSDRIYDQSFSSLHSKKLAAKAQKSLCQLKISLYRRLISSKTSITEMNAKSKDQNCCLTASTWDYHWQILRPVFQGMNPHMAGNFQHGLNADKRLILCAKEQLSIKVQRHYRFLKPWFPKLI